jgi:hypothetical protein
MRSQDDPDYKKFFEYDQAAIQELIAAAREHVSGTAWCASNLAGAALRAALKKLEEPQAYEEEVDERTKAAAMPEDSGELTFALTKVCLDYLTHTYRFEDLAQAIAALECTKLELYRRVVAPYEDYKKEQNGDVY